MMMRRGFTLIELLIVVTILSILAGGAIPYVQDYLDQSRTARAKTDLDEIKGALQRYEMTRGVPYTQTTIASLVGPFLSKSLIDPWGGPYLVAPGSSSVYTRGTDGKDGGGDDYATDYRARMAISLVQWIDTNQNGTVDAGDSLNLKLTRPADTTTNPSTNYGVDYTLSCGGAGAYASASFINNGYIASYGLTSALANFAVGSDTLTVISGTTIDDPAGNKPMLDIMKIQAR